MQKSITPPLPFKLTDTPPNPHKIYTGFLSNFDDVLNWDGTNPSVTVAHCIETIDREPDAYSKLVAIAHSVQDQIGSVFSNSTTGARNEIDIRINSAIDTRGKHSGRFFNPAKAGGPILDLNWMSASVTQAGIDHIKLHMDRFDPSDANNIMVGRLERILRGELMITAIDKRFYTHELREFERFRALGVVDGVNLKDDGATWNNIHAATLEDYKLKDNPELLYTPEAIEADQKQSDREYKQLGGAQVMSIIKTIVLNEKPEEVILFLTKNESGISFPRLDRLYNLANWAHVSDNVGLLILVKKMRDAGFIEYGGPGIIRGKNWREPAFMLEGKYNFD